MSFLFSWLQPRRIGLGIVLSTKYEVLEVLETGSCWPHVRKGDILTDVDDTCVDNLEYEKLVDITRGEEGSIAVLKLRRGEEEKTITVTRREKVVSVEERIAKQICVGKKRDDDDTVESVFRNHTNYVETSPHLTRDTFLHALKEFDMISSEVTDDDLKFVDIKLNQLDRNSDGKIDQEEFLRAVRDPTPIDEWVRSLCFHRLISDAIPRKEGEDPIKSASLLSPDQIEKIFAGVLGEMKTRFTKEVEKLRNSMKHADQTCTEIGLKFQLGKVSKMNCGGIADFHEGLMSRTGRPFLNFMDAMKTEHKCTLAFETPTFRLKTNPQREWGIVLKGETSQLSEEEMRHGRRIPNIDELNEKASNLAKLRREEVIALVLYTGPMFHVYNTVLRRVPDALYDQLKSSRSLFSTTIFVLVSAVQKLCRVTQVEPGMRLYRGVNNKVDLPDLLFKCDKNGCTGFVEWGFMSTTTNLNVALQYARSDGELGRLLVMEAGSVDRGASVAEFSQYPGENEFIFVPCSFLEQCGPVIVEVTSEFGVVQLTHVRVNANLTTRTVDEHEKLKQQLHVDAFRFHIDQIERELHQIAFQKKRFAEDSVEEIWAIQRLKSDPSAKEQHEKTVRDFISRILQQCTDVLARHKAIKHTDYIDNGVYRKVVLEMIEVKSMAVAKLKEWLKCGSFIRLRWNSDLRVVHRCWLAFLRQKWQACEPGQSRRKAALKLCKALGMVTDSVNELNELLETRLMRAAADGRRKRELELLIEAGASVNEKRVDGVTPIWLAAESGHDKCVKSLMKLQANVNEAANDGATPLWIAARNGRIECIRTLVNFNANLQYDSCGSQPIHQAALNGHLKALEELVQRGAIVNVTDHMHMTPLDFARKSEHWDCVKYLESKGGHGSEHGELRQRRLIVSTGDISDVDGFFALAEYAKTGADVLFIMNYPAYVGVEEKEVDPDFADANPGLGYKYSAKEVLAEAMKSPVESSRNQYIRFMAQYSSKSNENLKMKCALTDLAFAMATRVWRESQKPDVADHGQLLFGIGGINSINPFSPQAVKNEVLVYAKLIVDCKKGLDPEQGVVYNATGKQCLVCWEAYSHIYMDFNGSMAFWNGHLASQLSAPSVAERIRGVFIMGGVKADITPETSPPIPNILNRFSSATMNQLYHPQKTADFFAFLAQFQIPTWTVSNNVVCTLATTDPTTGKPTLEGVDEFLSFNDLPSKFLRQLAKAHYEGPYNPPPPRKPFDYYCAVALTDRLQQEARYELAQIEALDIFSVDVSELKPMPSVLDWGEVRTLFYSNVYGIVFISPSDSWEATRAAYARGVDVEVRPDDTAWILCKKQYFKKELELMRGMELSSIPVRDLSFQPISASWKIELERPPAPVAMSSAGEDVQLVGERGRVM